MELTYQTSEPDAITGAMRITADSAAKLLNHIVSQCHNRIVIFDLDSTLLDNRPRNAVIMQEFGKLHDQTELRKAKAEHWQDWSARNAMRAMGLSEPVIERLVDAYESYWAERFFTSQYCEFDREIAGAAEFVTELQQSGALIRYLTGRHEGMRTGTVSSLNELGFPAPESNDVSLIMKPEQKFSDDKFKQDAMICLKDEAEVLAAFDNEPCHINTYRESYANATCIHLDTDHSMRPIRLMAGIISIMDFRRE